MTDKYPLYFVDDDPMANRLFKRACEQLGFACRAFTSGADCLEAVRKQLPAMVLTDLNMPKMDGFELIHILASKWPELPILAITGQSTVERAVQAMQAGASDFLKKPYELKELELAIRRCLKYSAITKENRELKQRLRDTEKRYGGMVGNSPAMRQVYRMIEKLAEVECPVIIQGPSGSGKELAARAIHDHGPRHNEPFVVIDCGAMTDTLLESELFGHFKGAFTGAERNRTGLLESAAGGTVFLDEIGNISDAMQTKLLRVLEERTITLVGDSNVIPIQARFIAASHRDLPTLVKEGRFRHDLFHRLNVVTLTTPSLNQHREDIPLLIERFSTEFANKYQRPPRHFSNTMMRHLGERTWEGNIRELRNFVERCVIMSDGEHLDWSEMSVTAQPVDDVSDNTFSLLKDPDALVTLEEMESLYIRQVLDQVDNSQSKAAEILGINRTTLWRKLRVNEEI